MICEHLNFTAKVSVNRLSHDDGAPINGYSADITINCVECGLPFRFIGIAAGSSAFSPRCSIDGTELRAPIEPAEHAVFQPVARFEMPPRARQ